MDNMQYYTEEKAVNEGYEYQLGGSLSFARVQMFMFLWIISSI